MYKLVAIDMDDTLLDDQCMISEGTKQALAAAAARGVTVTIATGRMHASAEKIARQLDMNVPIITYQGALVKNLLDGRTLYERNVPERIASWVYEFCTARSLHLQAYVNDRLYAAEDNQKIKDYSALSRIPYTVEPDFASLFTQQQHKLLIIDEPDTLDKISVELAEAIGREAHITKSKPHFLEVMHPEGTKGSALRFLAGHVGCTMAETIGIGDSWNDRDLIELAGLGVAMGNAIDSLKQIADYIAPDNNSEGVRHVLEKFVL